MKTLQTNSAQVRLVELGLDLEFMSSQFRGKQPYDDHESTNLARNFWPGKLRASWSYDDQGVMRHSEPDDPMMTTGQNGCITKKFRTCWSYDDHRVDRYSDPDDPMMTMRQDGRTATKLRTCWSYDDHRVKWYSEPDDPMMIMGQDGCGNTRHKSTTDWLLAKLQRRRRCCVSRKTTSTVNLQQ